MRRANIGQKRSYLVLNSIQEEEMKFNRKLEYALIALKHMAKKRPGEVTSVKEVSDTYRCSQDVTAKVMQKLGRGGILSSSQGIQGGYVIQRDLAKINLLELFNIVLGPQAPVKCMHGTKSSCGIKESCNIIKPISVLSDRLDSFYKSLSVQQVLQEELV